MRRIMSVLLTITLIFALWKPVNASDSAQEPISQEGQQLLQYMRGENPKLLILRKNYGYMTFIEDFRGNALSLYLLEMTDRLINTGAKPDKEKYMEVLINIIATCDLDRAEDVAKMRSMDNLKSIKDYAMDVSEMAKDSVAVMIGTSPEVSDLENSIEIAVNGLTVLQKNLNNWIDALSKLETIVKDYSEYDSFLKMIEENSDGDLKSAAQTLRHGMKSVFEIKLDTYLDVSEEALKDYTEFFFSDVFFEVIKQLPEYKEDADLRFIVDAGDKIVDAVGTIQSSWNLGTAIGTIIGDVVVGGENLINRVLEMMALYDISVILQEKVLDTGSEFLSSIGKEKEKNLAEEYISFSNYLIGCRIRGEYCLYSIVAKDAGLLSWSGKNSAEEAEAWYFDKADRLLLIQKALFDTTYSEKKADEKTENDVFYEKIEELEKKYGTVKKGISTLDVDSDLYYTSSTPYEDLVYDEGIIITDIFDYDNDNTPELLSIRRKNGKIATVDYGELSELNRSEYVFEMFEKTDDGCEMSDSITLGVFDDLNWAVGASNMSVFRHETGEHNFICIETFITEQDHPHDTSIIQLYYDEERERFSVVGGIRFGYWFRENGVWLMEPSASNVIDYLSHAAISGFAYWEDIFRCNSNDDEKYLAARENKMNELGFTILQTRLDIENAKRETLSQMDYDDEYIEESQKLTEKISMTKATECYAPTSGSITNMAFLYEYPIRNLEDTNIIRLVHSIESYIESKNIGRQERANSTKASEDNMVKSEDNEKMSTVTPVEITDGIYEMTAGEAADFLGFHIRKIVGRRGHALMFSMIDTPSHPSTASNLFCSDKNDENMVGKWALEIIDDTISLYGAKIGMTKDQVQKLFENANWEISKKEYGDDIENNEVVTNGMLYLTFSPKNTNTNAYKNNWIITVSIKDRNREVESIILMKDDNE